MWGLGNAGIGRELDLVFHLMKTPSLPAIVACIVLSIDASAEDGWRSLFDGTSLNGWHISAASGHSRASGNKSGGRWVIEGGAIVGSQDLKGNGGLIITDEQFADFEVSLEMKNDFGPDSGLFLRSTEDGKAWQAMIDYHAGGNLMGIYGEGLGGNPHVRNYNFKSKVTEIEAKNTGVPPVALPVLPESWPYFWRADQWNELRARIVANPPHITTWINGVKIMEWKETRPRHVEKGGIALQVHGGGDHTNEFVRYRNIRVRNVEKTGASLSPEQPKRIGVEDPGVVGLSIPGFPWPPRPGEMMESRTTWSAKRKEMVTLTAASGGSLAALPLKEMMEEYQTLGLRRLEFHVSKD
jgi:3-keto-disaccharide hydrolase